MKKIQYLIIVIVLFSCKDYQNQKGISDDYKGINKEISLAFNRVDSLLKIDNGSFWGKKLYGPVMIVEPETRLMYLNENVNDNELNNKKLFYVDTLPKNITVANTSVEWNNKRWAQIQLPLPKSLQHQDILIIHELFHRIQPELGFQNIQEPNNKHLDTYNGRLLLKLELEALENAVKSKNKDEKLLFIKDALLFRNKRYKNIDIKKAENLLEINEGLAEYTALILSRMSRKQALEHLIQNKNTFYSNQTFVRSFVYYTIPMYGYILRDIYPNWHNEINRNTNLNDYFLEKFNISIDTIQSIKQVKNIHKYSFPDILNFENKREQKRIKRLNELYKTYTDSIVFVINFQNMNISFNPNNIVPLENLGTYYPTLKVIDDWGILSVEEGALISTNWDKVIVSKPLKISDTLIEGKSWKLKLNKGWSILRDKENYTLKE